MVNDRPLNIKKSDFEKNELTVKKTEVNKVFDSHWHDYFEIKLILGGHGTVIINGEQYEFKKGCLYFIIPANIHMFKPKSSVRLYNVTLRESILFDESIIQKLSRMNDLFFYLSDEEFSRVYYILELLRYENDNKSEYKNQMTKNLLECLLLSLIRKCTSKNMNAETYSAAIQIAISYMKMHFRDSISVEKMASILGFSSSYFSTLFHKTTGLTFTRYLNDMRLEYAKKLLYYDKFSIYEICGLSGFNTYSNFLKEFKNKFGVLPKDFRNTCRQKKSHSHD